MLETGVDPLLRPEVLAFQRGADELRGLATEADEAAVFWASLITDCCDDSAPTCDHPLCYEAWRQYPDG